MAITLLAHPCRAVTGNLIMPQHCGHLAPRSSDRSANPGEYTCPARQRKAIDVGRIDHLESVGKYCCDGLLARQLLANPWQNIGLQTWGLWTMLILLGRSARWPVAQRHFPAPLTSSRKNSVFRSTGLAAAATEQQSGPIPVITCRCTRSLISTPSRPGLAQGNIEGLMTPCLRPRCPPPVDHQRVPPNAGPSRMPADEYTAGE